MGDSLAILSSVIKMMTEMTASTAATMTTAKAATMGRTDVVLVKEAAFVADVSVAALEAESVPLRRSSRESKTAVTVYHEAAARKKSDLILSM